ncbi:MAG: thermonuclease family protein [Pseudomonadota bacterium]
MARRRISRIRDLFRTVAFLGLVAAGALYLSRFASDDFSGEAVVLDGDSLRLDGREVRLQGIDAPERDQTCIDASGRRFDCGERARQELRRLIDGANVACESIQRDRFGRSLSRCFADRETTSLNEQMVARGWAVDFGGYPGVEARARAQKTGLWAGEFDLPRQFRDRQRNRGDASWLGRFFGGSKDEAQ